MIKRRLIIKRLDNVIENLAGADTDVRKALNVLVAAREEEGKRVRNGDKKPSLLAQIKVMKEDLKCLVTDIKNRNHKSAQGWVRNIRRTIRIIEYGERNKRKGEKQ